MRQQRNRTPLAPELLRFLRLFITFFAQDRLYGLLFLLHLPRDHGLIIHASFTALFPLGFNALHIRGIGYALL